MDPLSEVLRSVRLIGGVFVDARFTAPWAVSAHMDATDVRPYLADPCQLIAYHVVIDGRLLLGVEGEPTVEVGPGEIVLLTRNDGHVLTSAPGLPVVRAGRLIEPAPGGGIGQIRFGGGGEPTHVVCGFLASDEGFNPLIATLPRVLTLDIRAAASRDWIEASVRFAAGELAAGRLAASGMMSRLSELLFVEAVRHFAAGRPNGEVGWLRGVGDSRIGPALALMHRDLAAPWSAEALAREVALSRSAFVERFTGLVGMPPIRYLTMCRLQAAQLHLREPRLSVREIARRVGYDSEEAFSRAFKREFGLSPAHWRGRAASAAQLPSSEEAS